MIIIPTKQDLNKNHNDSPKGDKNNRHVIPMKLQWVIRNPFAFLLAVGRAFSGTVGTLPSDRASKQRGPYAQITIVVIRRRVSLHGDTINFIRDLSNVEL